MRINIVGLFICVVFIVASCSQKKSTEDNKTQVVTHDSITKEEVFKTFLENFNNRPTFQRKRVLFPLEATRLDPSEYGMQTVTDEISYQDWVLLDFSYDSSYITRKMDRYEQRIRIYKDSSIIEHRGIDNGIYANFFFTKRNGKWYLKSFTDISF